MGGAFWTDTQPGDTITVWIVDVDGALLFIEAETHKDSGPREYRDVGPEVDQEIRHIVDSMRFE